MLDTLKQTCADCTRCTLSAGRTNSVFSAGPETAKIMLIGEGPGQVEDACGAPFIGRSGQLLDSLLEKAELSRERNVYITNIVKCRPPENRDPSPAEREACLPYLQEQMRSLHPQIIICTGRIAATQLIKPDFAVTKEHGIWFEKEGVFYVGIFHPAALLRNPNFKPLAIADFATIHNKATALNIL